jgi:predicted Rossmann fold nucleotide-binding protein DprA/Smf involved in DNA uptake
MGNMEQQYYGNRGLLSKKLTAFLSSKTIATNKVMACYDWATSLDSTSDCVVSGFQSPIEQDVLHFLLKKRIPIVVVLARAMYKHIPDNLKEAFDDERVLFVSISNNPRVNKATAMTRNKYVVDMSENILFGMFTESSSLYEVYQYAKANNKTLITI